MSRPFYYNTSGFDIGGIMGKSKFLGQVNDAKRLEMHTIQDFLP